MKKFLSMTLTAFVLILVVSLSLLVLSTSAASTYSVSDSKNVVFVMDSDAKIGDGSGRNASNPLWPDENKYFIDGGIKTDADNKPVYENGKPVYSSKQNYLKTALYQAADMLKDTGGTIVICGPVKIGADESYGSGDFNKDFIFPKSDNRLTITSEYGGVDYKETYSGKTYGGAKLSLETPAHIIYNSPVLMEYIKIETSTNNLGTTLYYRTICANGNDLVMGKGIKTSYTDGGSNGNHYVHIVGGGRYGNLNSDTNITVMSGTYGTISGSTWGVSGSKYVQTGDVHITIDGDINDPVIVRASMTGTSANDANVMVDGDVYVTVSGARFGTTVAAVGPGGFAGEGHKAVFKIKKLKSYNVSIYDILPTSNLPNITAQRTLSEAVLAAQKDGEFIFDAEDIAVTSMDSKYTANQLVSRWVKGLATNDTSKVVTWDKVIYPASWATSVNSGHGLTIPSTVIQNSVESEKNVDIGVNYKNPHTSETFAANGTKVSVVCDTSAVGSADFAYKYGKVTVVSGKTTVAAAPSVELLGVRIKTNSTIQGLRFVAELNGNGAHIVSKGVLVAKSKMLSDPENLTLDKTFGSIGSKIAREYSIGDKTAFECDYDQSVMIGEYNTNYVARAYVIFKVNGVNYTVYSDPIERNLYEVAREVVTGTEEDSTVLSYLTTNVVNKVNSFDDTTLQVSEAELEAVRKKVTDYMFLQANIEWSPSETFYLYNSVGDKDLTDYRYQHESGSIVEGVGMTGALFEKGKTYRGMPYTSSSDPDMDTANYEALASLIDSNGILDISQIKVYNEDGTIKKQITPYTGYVPNWKYYTMSNFNSLLSAAQKGAAYTNYTIFPGSHCSQAVFSAWNTVINNRASVGQVNATYNLVPGKDNASMAVGPYEYIYSDYSKYDGEITDSFNKYDSTAGAGRYLSDAGFTHVRDSDTLYISKYLNEAEVMYESYKALKPGDAMIQYTYSYSTSLNADSNKAATYAWNGSGHTRLVMSVEYNASNPGSSTVTTLECANWTVPYVKPANSGVSGSDSAIRNNDSCWMERHYTFDNLIDTGYIPVTIPEMRNGLQTQNCVVLTDVELGAGTFEGTVSSEKQLVSLTVKITNGQNTVYEDTKYLIHEAMHLSKYDISKLGLGKYFTAGNTYTVTVTAGTPGEVVYTDGQPTGYTPTTTNLMTYTFTA